MKTFTAQEFEIEFYRAMHEWVQGGKVGPDPRGEWEYQGDIRDKWWALGNGVPNPSFNDRRENYRWKPAKKRIVVIDGVELVAPEVDAPTDGERYFIEGWDGEFFSYLWGDRYGEDIALANGKVFLTREDCLAMADAQRKQRLGGVL